MKCKKYGCEYKGRAKKSAYGDLYETCPKCSEDQLKKAYKVSIELSETQADVVRVALESYSRMLIGQLDYALEPIRWKTKSDWYQDVMPVLDEVKHLIFELAPNASYGIYSTEVSDNARVAWDIQQVIRNKMSWHSNPKGSMTVNFDRPMKSSQEELPICSIVKE